MSGKKNLILTSKNWQHFFLKLNLNFFVNYALAYVAETVYMTGT